MRRVFFYGTLMGNSIPGLRFLTRTDVGGLELLDVGPFPAVVRGNGIVSGELYEVEDEHAFARIDSIEGYNEDDHYSESNLYRRVDWTTVDGQKCELYLYNRPHKHLLSIESGDWRDKPNVHKFYRAGVAS